MNKSYSLKFVQKQLMAEKHHKTIVLVGGSFDLLHVGHLRFLKNAKKHGNILIVALNSDSHIRSYKEKNRPIISELHRAEMLEGFKVVDYVFLTNKGLYDPFIYKTIQPNILGLGKEKNKKASRLRSIAELKKTYPQLKVVFINKNAKNISTTLIEKKILLRVNK